MRGIYIQGEREENDRKLGLRLEYMIMGSQYKK
jgi:hypothetical protein